MTKGHAKVLETSLTRLRAIYATLGPVLVTLDDMAETGETTADEARAAMLAAIEKVAAVAPKD